MINLIDFKGDTVLAVFNWITTEIEYDTQSMLYQGGNNFAVSKMTLLADVINRKKGVCYHYAELFNEILQRLKYRSYVILGYSRRDLIFERYAHAWNAVSINGDWYLFDPTWSSGYVEKFKFFKQPNVIWYKVSPSEFIKTHVPFDPIWQFLSEPVSHYEVTDSSNVSKRIEPIDYHRSIMLWDKMTESEQKVSELATILNMGVTNKVIARYVEFVGEHISYNGKVDSIHLAYDKVDRAARIYNNYMIARNKYFRSPKLTDSQISAPLDNVEMLMDEAMRLIDAITTDNYSLVSEVMRLRRSIAERRINLEKEQRFARKYLSTKKYLRYFLFFR